MYCDRKDVDVCVIPEQGDERNSLSRTFPNEKNQETFN